MHNEDEKIMRSALKLAERGIGLVEPNPAVGCIIVKSGQIVGTGYHKKYGGPHAEINAIEDCRTLSTTPEGGTMYVTLEPCCHQGKTGPCTAAIIAAKPARVVVASLDPSPHAAGQGVAQLREAGIEVEVGLCEQDAKALNAPFFQYVTTGKCWVILKWAQSLDGKLAYARQSEKQRWISNELSRKDVHKLRRRVGAVVVGINTVLADDPLLTPRPSQGKKPLRVVLDSTLKIPLESQLLRTVKTAPVLICTRDTTVAANPELAEQITAKGAEVIHCPDGADASNLRFLIEQLSERGVQQVLVEGGPQVLSSFLEEGLADEVCIYVAPKLLGVEGSAYIAEPMTERLTPMDLQRVEIKAFGDDVRISGRLHQA